MDRLDFIRTAIAGGQLPHAFLLEGEDALPAAELIAAAAVCTGVSKPCGVCEACKKPGPAIIPIFSGMNRGKTSNPIP